MTTERRGGPSGEDSYFAKHGRLQYDPKRDQEILAFYRANGGWTRTAKEFRISPATTKRVVARASRLQQPPPGKF